MTRREFRPTRPGVAAVWALVVLAAVSAISVTLVGRFAAVRRQTDAYRNRVQADALARSGYELAVARLLTGGVDFTETVTPVPGGEVKITVKKDAGAGAVYRVESAVRYSPDGVAVATVSQTLRRAVKRVETPAGVRVEAFPTEP